jgi:diaminopimelate epimerase
MGEYPFLKGHGTENDFVLLPDYQDELTPERVRALCDRRAGIGGDGVLRVVPPSLVEPVETRFFMDYRNADGSVAEMCGNGIRLFARYLVDEGLADPSGPIEVGTRDGVKTLTVDGDVITVDLGVPRVLADTKVTIGQDTWAATHVDMGNPHAVVFLEDESTLASLDLSRPPEHDASAYPDGVNVELVVRRGERHVGMRVHERGSGETRSCGTGTGAVLVAVATADAAPRPATYRVDVPGGTLTLTWTEDDHVLLAGPAVIVARGTTSL